MWNKIISATICYEGGNNNKKCISSNPLEEIIN